MVSDRPKLPIQVKQSHNPDYPQPFEGWMVGIGIPGAIIAGLATSVLGMMAAWGQPMFAWLAIGSLWSAYLLVMGVLWVGVASES